MPIELDEAERVMGAIGGYPDTLPHRPDEGQRWGSAWSYESLAALIGEVVASEDTGDYQGTTYFLLRRGPLWGFLAQDYGSCSGCDWLEDCDSYDDYAELFADMKKSVTWFDDTAELAAHIRRDEAPQHSWYGDQYKRMVDALVAHLPEQSRGADEPESASDSDDRSTGDA